MKINLMNWDEVFASTFKSQQGRAFAKTSVPCNFYAGYDTDDEIVGHVLLATGHEIDFEFGANVQITVEPVSPHKKTALFVYSPMSHAIPDDGEIYSNADRRPSESGTMAAVTAALRLHKLQMNNDIKKIRSETALLHAAAAAAAPPDPDLVQEPSDPPETVEPDESPES